MIPLLREDEYLSWSGVVVAWPLSETNKGHLEGAPVVPLPLPRDVIRHGC